MPIKIFSAGATRAHRANDALTAGAHLLHHVISFHFKAHPRFLEAAAFAWPSASWRFNR
ncbi:hypothetical protein [Xylophilus sp. GOD-11R]|uniref:hypothetical protein n=1 Tax=Xylophilus sp. GOD-11R TaxID=3089814 RepID=UPI00298CEA0C|nr:hypothetical protein [Xylophilus sp. GOD-11R]WPB59270.1 hypothetical protein R9X41_11735 [Xylophilus sp. GOD-11R]